MIARFHDEDDARGAEGAAEGTTTCVREYGRAEALHMLRSARRQRHIQNERRDSVFGTTRGPSWPEARQWEGVRCRAAAAGLRVTATAGALDGRKWSSVDGERGVAL